MTSSVFFKFKSQKEPTRVEFDGTGISVFELKREIITKSGLGDGTDFDLHIYTDDNSEGEFTQRFPGRVTNIFPEYDDDTTIIPRSTTVIARRQPALKPGAGRAARYVSGKMPVTAKNAGRKEQAAKASASKPSSDAISQMNNAMTEEEKMAAMFAAQTEQWSAQQEEMSQ
jgi:protein MPE1